MINIKLSKPITKVEMKAPAFIEDHYYTDILNKNLDRDYLVDKKRGRAPHVSDIVGTCSKRNMFARLDRNPKMSERTRNYFYDGEAIDSKLRNTFKDIVKGGNYDTEAFVEYGPVIARPDLVDKDRKCVIELKTTDPTSGDYLPKIHNVYQLQAYMSALDYEDGVLWYHIITRKQKTGLWREFHTKLNSKDRSEIRSLLLERAQLWEQAYDERNPYLLPGVQDDATLNWMCRGDWNEEIQQYDYCPYVEQCSEGWAYRQQYFKDHPGKKKPTVKKYIK